MVEPVRPDDDLSDFDLAMVEAGLKRYGRRAVPGDSPTEGRPFNPETGEMASDAELAEISAAFRAARWFMIAAFDDGDIVRCPLNFNDQ
jgi:hypothetical protein